MPGGAGWKCKARPMADPPQDCDFPFCGCCPDAEGVIEALVESGWVSDAEVTRLRAERAELLAALKAVMGVDDDDKVPDVMALARAVIAKAEAPHAD